MTEALTEDPMALAFTDRDLFSAPLLVERTDGHTSTTDLAWWMDQPGARPPGDLAALAWVRPGTALDIGCSTGRHLAILTERGIGARGIDTCPPAVELAYERGVEAQLADAHTYTPIHPVDSVIALGGGLGIAETKDDVPLFLERLASWLAPGGTIITSSVNWKTTAHAHRAWVDNALAQGRYPGDVRLRLRYKNTVGDWFDWTWIDPDTLRTLAAEARLTVTRTQTFGPAWYAAELTREAW
ncbi:class I SAM-dependent methyltransferase [Nocardiopsis exhalans]|uniref:SAM-dependent methyltransferase n=2 Tax=Nocardiopsis TaxID=2013 RepID=A0A840WBA8_9ACTN|nr:MULTISPECIES: class I SAM-dependent methyltransferase [Nocardiopsis]MBB5493412.1 SAM-dependent methyltransferase [Nocardiopsis metallicus]USY19864.1 class I SAM-dependent methyltransferase [Nocardiopsis exhalans]